VEEVHAREWKTESSRWQVTSDQPPANHPTPAPRRQQRRRVAKRGGCSKKQPYHPERSGADWSAATGPWCRGDNRRISNIRLSSAAAREMPEGYWRSFGCAQDDMLFRRRMAPAIPSVHDLAIGRDIRVVGYGAEMLGSFQKPPPPAPRMLDFEVGPTRFLERRETHRAKFHRKQRMVSLAELRRFWLPWRGGPYWRHGQSSYGLLRLWGLP